MTFVLYMHPFASFCQKVTMGLHELDVPFEGRVVDLGDPVHRAELAALWPMVKFPVLRDEERGVTVVESSRILEHVDRRGVLVPLDRDEARTCRTRDQFFDLYVQLPMQKIVADRLRPAEARDAYGVEEARAQLGKAYDVLDDWLREGPWACGAAFGLADCAAAPALYYADKVTPLGARPHLRAYVARLEARPSWQRVAADAAPYAHLFPPAPPAPSA